MIAFFGGLLNLISFINSCPDATSFLTLALYTTNIAVRDSSLFSLILLIAILNSLSTLLDIVLFSSSIFLRILFPKESFKILYIFISFVFIILKLLSRLK